MASTRSAHVRAYEAAISTLHNQYLDRLHNLSELPDGYNPHDAVLVLARKHCGLSAPPKADLRFQVEACWTSFNIRFQLIDIAQAIAKVLEDAAFTQPVRECWWDFLDYVVASITRDADLATDIAEGAQSHRQVAKTVLFSMEAQYQASNHRVACRASRASPTFLQELKDEARKGCTKAKLTLSQHSRKYRNAMPALPEQAWLYENFVKPGEAIIERWAALETRLQRGVFYSTVSDEEKRSIIKAFSAGFLGFSESRNPALFCIVF